MYSPVVCIYLHSPGHLGSVYHPVTHRTLQWGKQWIKHEGFKKHAENDMWVEKYVAQSNIQNEVKVIWIPDEKLFRVFDSW